MQVLDQLPDPSSRAPSAVAIGNFDGVHRGHQAILARVVDEARTRGVRSAAITFDPHPLVEIAPARAPVEITTLDQRIRLVERSGIDVLLIQKFDDLFRHLEPEDFVQRYLIEAFMARSVTVGYNFRFGFRHSGDLRTLERYRHIFEVAAVPPILERGIPISSTLVRRLIGEGHVGTARRMLGRCYEVEGTVVAGVGRGREATVPTLNVEAIQPLIPLDGVYLTRVAVDADDVFRPAVTNVGVRPTFGAGPRSIETFVIDAHIPHARRLRIRFLKRLREEVRFSGSEALRRQILDDVDRARKYFRRLERLERTECGTRA